MNKLFLVLLLCIINFSVFSQTVTWTGGNRTHNWEEGKNWDTGIIPCSTCDVQITDDSVSINSNPSIKSLTLSGSAGIAKLNVNASRILSITNSTAQSLLIEDGSVCDVDGDINITNSGGSGIVIDDGILNLTGNSLVDNIDDYGIYIPQGTLNLHGNLDVLNTDLDGIKIDALGQMNILKLPAKASPTLDITDALGDGILSAGNFYSNGDIKIINCDNAINNSGVFETAKKIFIYTSNTGIRTTNSFIISGTVNLITCTFGVKNEQNTVGFINNGSLSIYASSTGLKHNGVAGKFTNESSGIIYINANSQVAMEVESNFLNKGSIQIGNKPTIAIDNIANFSGFINQGTITINNATANAIKNTGASSSFLNDVSGIITIDSSNSDGIYTERKFINKGQLTLNSGIGGYAIENYQNSNAFANEGQITINNKQIRNIGTGSYFYNKSGGMLTMESQGILSTEIFRNDGSIVINNAINGIAGVDIKDDFTNYGEIEINNPEIGIKFNRSTGVIGALVNKSGGTIEINNPTISGMELACELNNQGSISINSSLSSGLFLKNNEFDFMNSGTFEVLNSDRGILIDFTLGGNINNLLNGEINIVNSGIDAIKLSSGRLTNDGEIIIDESVEIGINNASDTLVNNGHIDIRNSGNFGISSSFMENGVLGVILVDNSDGYSAIGGSTLINNGEIKVTRANESLSFGRVENSGNIIIYDMNGRGLNYAINSGIWNKVSGYIEIDTTLSYGIETASDIRNEGIIKISHTGDSGIRLKPNVSFGDSLLNYGTIIINSIIGDGISSSESPSIKIINYAGGAIKIDSVSISAISSPVSFLNEACATINLGGKITNNGTMTNNGLVIQRTTMINDFIQPFVNNAVYEDHYGVVLEDADFQNNGILTQNITGSPSENIAEANVINMSSPSNIDLYIERTLTTLAGTFNASDGGVRLNGIGYLADSVFFQSSIGAGCFHVVAIPILNNRDCNGQYVFAEANQNIVTTTDWFNPNNWSTGKVPDGCTNVEIDYYKTIIPSGFKARVHKLYIKENGNSLFEVETGAVFEAEVME